jgi:hypothetical protein
MRYFLGAIAGALICTAVFVALMGGHGGKGDAIFAVIGIPLGGLLGSLAAFMTGKLDIDKVGGFILISILHFLGGMVGIMIGYGIAYLIVGWKIQSNTAAGLSILSGLLFGGILGVLSANKFLKMYY